MRAMAGNDLFYALFTRIDAAGGTTRPREVAAISRLAASESGVLRPLDAENAAQLARANSAQVAANSAASRGDRDGHRGRDSRRAGRHRGSLFAVRLLRRAAA